MLSFFLQLMHFDSDLSGIFSVKSDMPREERIPRFLDVKNTCKPLAWSIGSLLQGRISVPIKFTLIFQVAV